MLIERFRRDSDSRQMQQQRSAYLCTPEAFRLKNRVFVKAAFCRTFRRKMGNSASQTKGLIKPDVIMKAKHWAFNGPYAPVHEEVFAELPLPAGVTLPKDLEGAYVRNGPNPWWNLPKEDQSYHWFLGTGMVHTVRLKDGKAWYNNHILRTKNFNAEQRTGGPHWDKIANSSSMRGFLVSMVLEKIGLQRGTVSGPSNTSLVYHSSKLMALSEGDMPMELLVLQDGKMESDEKYLYKDMWNAHPKIDPVSGKLYWLDYDISGLSPKFSYGVISPDGTQERSCTGTMGGGKSVMIHDLGITEQYALVIDAPVLVNVENFTSEKILWRYEPSHGTRIGIFPKDGESGKVTPTWFEIETCWIFHVANSWEEGDTVVLVVVRWDGIDMSGHPVKEDLLKPGFDKKMYEYRFDMKNKTVAEKCLFSGFTSLEFPVVNLKGMGRKCRYIWAAGSYEGEPHFHRIFKFDLEKGTSSSYGCCESGKVDPAKLTAGEAFFTGTGDAEDQGYLVTYLVEPDGNGPSSFLVMDSANLEPVCQLALPVRVPLGFHGIWLSDQQVQAQIK